MSAELIVRTGDPVLASLERACQELAQAKTIQEAKQICDIASAAAVYAREQRLGEESIAFAIRRLVWLTHPRAASIRSVLISG